MQGDQVTDKNLCLSMLNELKFNATCLTSRILECADQQLRQDYMHALNQTFDEQMQVYNLAHQQGWYKPMQAEQNMISQVQNSAQKMMTEQQQSMMTQHHQAQYQATQAPYQQNIVNPNTGIFQNYNQPNQYNYGGMQQYYPR
ncbi:spore coat protein [Desulfotomaculum sp. 1211_IL3151]|uniref:spore coat protein n=1 Tax=Desulfotomaculum sp. 1211_IL3151 TaxID=3084055 RepID=UPI002FDB2931